MVGTLNAKLDDGDEGTRGGEDPAAHASETFLRPSARTNRNCSLFSSVYATTDAEMG